MINNVFLKLNGDDTHVLSREERGEDDDAAVVVHVEELASIELLPPDVEEALNEGIDSPTWHWLSVEPAVEAVTVTVALAGGRATTVTIRPDSVTHETGELPSPDWRGEP